MWCLEGAPGGGRVACRPRALLSTISARAQHLPNNSNCACNQSQLNKKEPLIIDEKCKKTLINQILSYRKDFFVTNYIFCMFNIISLIIKIIFVLHIQK